jgi:NAD(P)-dependent dehydrogenase (short-subunit alcohol dehydrogenase family)
VPAALVTGASSGIGQAIAADLVAQSWDVTAVARRPERGAPPGSVPLAADVSTEDGCIRAVREHVERAGRLDLLVTAAGINLHAPVAESGVDVFDEQMAVNARGPFVLAREAIPHLLEARGLIVVVASLMSVEGGAGMGGYAASKHAALGLVRSLNLELNGRGVRATALCPAFVATPMVLPWATVPADEMIQTDDVVRIVRMLVELGPNCVVEELVVLRTGRVYL